MLLKLENISKTYKKNAEEIFVLDKIDLDIPEGKTIALTGESGAGKSTLLHLAGLLDSPDTGSVIYNNEVIDTTKDLSFFRNEKFGFIFQFHYLLEDFTTLENVAMPLLVGKNDVKTSFKKAEEILKLIGMDHRQKHFSSELSGGELQRVAFARALVNKPEIIFADEPTGNLDPKTSLEIINLMKKLNKTQNQTFVIVTHNLDIASQMDHHYILENRKLIKVR